MRGWMDWTVQGMDCFRCWCLLRSPLDNTRSHVQLRAQFPHLLSFSSPAPAPLACPQQCSQAEHKVGQKYHWVNIFRGNPQSMKDVSWWVMPQLPHPGWKDPELSSTQFLRSFLIWLCSSCSEHWPVLPPPFPAFSCSLRASHKQTTHI